MTQDQEDLFIKILQHGEIDGYPTIFEAYHHYKQEIDEMMIEFLKESCHEDIESFNSFTKLAKYIDDQLEYLKQMKLKLEIAKAVNNDTNKAHKKG